MFNSFLRHAIKFWSQKFWLWGFNHLWYIPSTTVYRYCSYNTNTIPIYNIFTSKPIELTPSTLKADLAVFVNSNMLITNIIGKNAQWLCVSSTSASNFEFLELPIGTGSTQFEFKFVGDTRLQIYISRSHIYSGRTLEFISAQHKRI